MDETVADPLDIETLRPLELHYFRVPRERWELMLARARQMGADAVRTIVPWSWHELSENVFDLTGITHPARDVTGFLETCRGMGFPVILRVSAHAGAGLLGGGVPGWLIREHPEIRALGPDTQPRRYPASGGAPPSAEHPTFLKYLERWYQELSNALGSWGPPDGPVVALRVDGPGPDEPEPPTEGVPAGWDYNPHVVEVQWPVWLRQRYDGIDALNTAWGADYVSFSDAEFPRHIEATGLTQRLDDATRFVAHAGDHARETYTRLLCDAGWGVPILTDRNGLPVSHVAQVDPDPPGVGAGVRWAMDAPVRADGWPRRRFWAVKAATLEMEEGVKPVEGGTMATAAESGRFRLPRPESDYGVYRLLLDGRPLEATSRKRGDKLLLDYAAADELGETDMYILLDDASAPLTGFLREYLTSLLMGRAQSLRRAGAMCQAVVEAFASAASTPSEEATQPPGPTTEGLQAAEWSLVEARRAARRAAASVGRLERLASEVRGDMPATASMLPDLSALPPAERERLAAFHDACAQVAPALREAAESTTVLCQVNPGGEALTIQGYQAAFEAAQDAAREAEAILAETLAGMRADLAAGSLSPVAWPLQDWLTRTTQGLTAGWLD
jgi:hypothetical protein